MNGHLSFRVLVIVTRFTDPMRSASLDGVKKGCSHGRVSSIYVSRCSDISTTFHFTTPDFQLLEKNDSHK
jgi:hypothetical protein